VSYCFIRAGTPVIASKGSLKLSMVIAGSECKQGMSMACKFNLNALTTVKWQLAVNQSLAPKLLAQICV